MSPMMQVGLLLVNTIGSLIVTLVVLRFLLQLVRADFYNPMSQFIVRFTNPMLMPLRRIIPGLGGFDLASVVLAYVLQMLFIVAVLLMYGGIAPIANMLLWGAIALFALVLKIYFWGMVIVIIVSWIAPSSYNPAVVLVQQLLEPVMQPVRNIVPDLGGLDLSPIFLFLGIKIIEILLIGTLAQMASMPAIFL